MKELLMLVCVIIAHVNSQPCGCGCSLPPLPCRPNPPLARPLPPCPSPLPPCPPPLPPCPCSSPISLSPRPLPAPIPVCPRPLPQCQRPCEYATPVVEYIDVPVMQAPIVTYEVVSPCASLPTCNCPAPPTLPVSAQILPSIGSPLSLPFLNAGLGLGISPCLGGLAELAVSPLGLINPFLPAASPISALAPTVSSLYPPIDPCNCGCKYLRQIPIPPPFI